MIIVICILLSSDFRKIWHTCQFHGCYEQSSAYVGWFVLMACGTVKWLGSYVNCLFIFSFSVRILLGIFFLHTVFSNTFVFIAHGLFEYFCFYCTWSFWILLFLLHMVFLNTFVFIAHGLFEYFCFYCTWSFWILLFLLHIVFLNTFVFIAHGLFEYFCFYCTWSFWILLFLAHGSFEYLCFCFFTRSI